MATRFIYFAATRSLSVSLDGGVFWSGVAGHWSSVNEM